MRKMAKTGKNNAVNFDNSEKTKFEEKLLCCKCMGGVCTSRKDALYFSVQMLLYHTAELVEIQ
jgi:hypothetical protein